MSPNNLGKRLKASGICLPATASTVGGSQPLLTLFHRFLDWHPADWFKASRLGLLAGVALIGALSASPAFAVHDDGIFELDVSNGAGAANVVDDAGTAGDDWAKIYNKTDGAFARVFIPDTVGTAENSFFTGGGSKDEEAIDTSLGANKAWLYGNTNDVIPDKDDIVNAFAAAYKNPTDGHIHFYFGADRFDTSGDAEIGFWFFRSPVKLGTLPNFVGKHSIGDVLVLVHFVNGGAVGEANVYQVTAVSSKGVPTLTQVAATDEAECAVAGTGDKYCAVINNIAGEDPPWNYTNKDGQSAYQVAALMEGGIDMTALFPDKPLGCFSSFMAETRSSHSLDAQLKDFALGAFDVCGIKVKKDGDTLSKVSDPADYTITITNTGIATLYKKNISDDVLGVITKDGVDQANTNVVSNTCGASLAPAVSCVITLQRTVKAGDPNPLSNTATVLYTENGDFSGVSLPGTSNHSVNLFKPEITLTKEATPSSLLQGGNVDYKIVLTNTSSSNTPALNCTITDANLGINEPVLGLLPNSDKTLTPSLQFATIPTWCGPSEDGKVACTNTAKATCSPTGWPNEVKANADATVLVELAKVELTVDKSGPQYAKVGDEVEYTIKIVSTSNVPVTFTQLTDSLLGDLSSYCLTTLQPGATCEFKVLRTVQAGDPDPVLNKVSVSVQDAFANTAFADDSHSVDLVHPGYTVAKSCVSEPVPAGAAANFSIKIANTGDTELLLDIQDLALNPPVDLSDVALGKVTGSCAEADFDNNAADGCYLIEGSMIATGTEVDNTVSVHATLAEKYGLPNEIDKTADASCKVEQGGAARTLGFWKTHGGLEGYTCHVFDSGDHLNGSASLGWKTLTSCEDVLGVFWANAAKNTDGSKRSQLCQATELASVQLMAAILNTGLDNGKAVPIDPKSGKDIITAEQDALRACYDAPALNTVCDRTNILRLKTLLDTYNNSGHDTAIIDLDGTAIAPADPKDSHQDANPAIVDCSSK